MDFVKQNYVTGHDSTRIHYQACGSGPVIACINSVGADSSYYRYLVQRFAPDCQVVTWDLRGHGQSFFPQDLGELDANVHAEDLQGVLDDLKVEKAILIGHQSGVPVAIEYYRHNPQRVDALVLVAGSHHWPFQNRYEAGGKGGWAKRLADFSFALPTLTESIGEAFADNSRTYDLAGMWLINNHYVKRQDIGPVINQLGNLDAKLFSAMLRAFMEYSVEEVLAEIKAPTLLVAGQKDRITPLTAIRDMHKKITDADLLEVKGASHAVLLEQPELVGLMIEKFLRDRLPDGLEGPWGLG